MSKGFRPVSPSHDFVKMENELLSHWYKDGIVDRYLHRNDKSDEKFSFLDGPITANNPMGVHHGWGRTYKDFWQRFWNMRGRRLRFQNGFDEQGLWVEVEVEKELGLHSKKDIENLVPGDSFASLEKFINLCKDRVKKFSGIQTEQSKRLGYFMDWENSYHTSSDANNYAIWNFLKTVNDKGWLYKGHDSVPWCPRCGTAISQHEILTEEYKVLTHRTVVFKLPITTKGWENTSLLAWTTTPWTIPGNVALAVDPELSYWKMEKDGEMIILVNPTASGDLNKEDMLVNQNGLAEGWVKTKDGELKGRDLIGLEYKGPYDELSAVKKALNEYKHRVVLADPQILPINPAEGTGIVHVAPGAGSEDFKLGKKEKLPVIEEIDESGVFLEGFDFVSGQHVKKAMPLIIEDLSKRKIVHKDFDYEHRYPTCWRCHVELVWRVVDEWYIGMDKKDDSGKTYREQMMDVTRKINWMPSWGLERELDWLKNMHDWLISKKRYWGLALPIWECTKCGNFEVVGSKEDLKEKAVEGFDKFDGNSPHRPWIDQVKIKCEKCGEITSRIPDVGNPWLDAGIVPFSTLPEDFFPADFITESFPGQFKNWFYSLIAMSTGLKATNPFKNILGFASVRDEKGEEMHKSKGNSIEFNEAADKIGVDVMRWLYLKQDPESNLNFGYSTADDVRRYFHLRLWNVYSFLVTYANLNNFIPTEELDLPLENVLDKWIISRLNESIKNVTKFVENYQADKAVEDIENFIINDLSNWYVRRSRDRVAIYSDREDKRACLTTLWFVLSEYSKLLASFIPFTAEEIYTNLTGEESVHLSDWPKHNEELINSELNLEMKQARDTVELAHAQRKEAEIKVRQPLSTLVVWSPIVLSEGVKKLIADEVNVEKVKNEKGELKVKLDTKISDILKEKGEARDIIRKIQEERKKLGTRLDEKVNVTLPSWPKEFEGEIKKKALVENLSEGDFSVKPA